MPSMADSVSALAKGNNPREFIQTMLSVSHMRMTVGFFPGLFLP